MLQKHPESFGRQSSGMFTSLQDFLIIFKIAFRCQALMLVYASLVCASVLLMQNPSGSREEGV